MRPLPAGWRSFEIGQIASVKGGGTPPSKDETNFSESGGIPWITPADLSGYRGMYISRGRRNLSQKGFDSCSAVMLPKGTVLFSSRAPVGYVAIAQNPVATNQGFKSFILPSGFDSRYVYYYLRHIRPIAESMATGTTFKELSGTNAAKLPFLVAPPAEQQRIADKLDRVLATVETCKTRLEAIPAILKRFRQSVLAAAVGGRLTEDWRRQNVARQSGSELVDDMRRQHLQRAAGQRTGKVGSGNNPRAEVAPNAELADPMEKLPRTWGIGRGADVVEPGAEIVYGIVQPGPKLATGVPYVRGMDIESGQILVDQLLKTSPEIAAKYSRASIKGGDVLLGIIRATKVAVVPSELNGANITQGTARFRPSSGVRSRYLALVLEAPDTQKWLHAHYRGIDMPGLNLADVRRVPVPIPPLIEQDEILRRVEILLGSLAQVEGRSTVAATSANWLATSVLEQAFSGKLVPQDPNEEPAALDQHRMDNTTQVRKSKRQKRSRRTDMIGIGADSLRSIIQQMPAEGFSFDDLRAIASSDYESLKNMVFDLLADPTSGLSQFFDERAGEMRFQRKSA